MSVEENEATVRRAFETLNQRGNMSAMDDVAGAGYIAHLPGMDADLQGMKQFGDSFFAAVPELRHDVIDIFGAGDRVALRMRLHGKHTGDLVGPAGTIPASGRDISFESTNIWRFEGGKAMEVWVSFDMMGVLQQVGALPG